MLQSREKSLASARNQTLAIQPITHHYTDCAIPAASKIAELKRVLH
jgi:hypothetical protein